MRVQFEDIEDVQLLPPACSARCSHCGTKLEEEMAAVAPALQSKLPRYVHFSSSASMSELKRSHCS